MKPRIANHLRVNPEKVTIFRGRHVLIADGAGLLVSGTDGYYLHGTRFLSRFEWLARGERIESVCCNGVEPHSMIAYSLLASPAGAKAAPPGDDDPSGGEIARKGIEIQSNTYVGGGFRQDIHVANRALAEATIALDCALATDFADFDEVAAGQRRQTAPIGRTFRASGRGEGELTFVYEHPRINHATKIRIRTSGVLSDQGTSLRCTLRLRPGQCERIEIEVAPVFLGDPIEPWYGLDGEPTGHNQARAGSNKWLADCAALETSNPIVQAAWDRAATDLWSLQALDGEGEKPLTPMAGIPKFTALFGRDALVASLQSALLNPSTLRGTLSSLGEGIGTKTDDRFDEQPGKHLHQRQLSPLALTGETPFAHYYGDYSAPGLYVLGAAADFAHTGDRRAFDAIRDKVCATLDWMDRDGDIDHDGFYEYRTRAEKGIKNQGWKDSRQAILYPDGSFVPNPLAVAEIQGIYYAAKQSIACLFAALGEKDRAARLFTEAAALKQRFNERFWTPDLNFFALALGPDKQPVRTIASNVGSCLAYGIIDEDKAHAVAERMLAPDMFSGWGVRTLSADHPAYNPLGYHLGAVWPVSNANICFGLRRYGFDAACHKIAKAVFEASTLFDSSRLPEAYGGHARDKRHPHPGIYPASCSPQAWSASAIIHICHAVTGLIFLAPLETLVIDPALPEWLPDLKLGNLTLGGKRASLGFRRNAAGVTEHTILEADRGLRFYRPDPSPAAGKDRIAMAIAAVAGA